MFVDVLPLLGSDAYLVPSAFLLVKLVQPVLWAPVNLVNGLLGIHLSNEAAQLLGRQGRSRYSRPFVECLLLAHSGSYGFAQEPWKYRRLGRTPTNELNVLVVASALAIELFGDTPTVGEESRGLENRAHVASGFVHTALHAKSRHARKLPRPCAPRMLVQEVLSPVRLQTV